MKAYKNPASTIDLIYVNSNNEILLIERKHNPFKGYWALPGGFLENGKETLEGAAIREFKEETGLIVKKEDLVLIGVYSNPTRDPRGHVISHAYTTKSIEGTLKAGDDAKDAKFFSLDKLPLLAFDHEEIIEDYLIWRGGR